MSVVPFCYFGLITMCHKSMAAKNGNFHIQSLDRLRILKHSVEISTVYNLS